MTEKILTGKKNGFVMLFLSIVLYLIGIAVLVIGAVLIRSKLPVAIPMVIIGVLWVCVGWIPFLGLSVLTPQEPAAMTLFG